MDTVILIPAYKPQEALITLLAELRETEVDLLVVNDGSGTEFDGIFQRARSYAEVIGYEKNHGKGYALRFGMEFIRKERLDCRYIITADADGQHTPADIRRMSENLHRNGGFLLGCRRFVGNVPFRSRAGNAITRAVYAISSGVHVSDTQTGLRGFDRSLLDWMLTVGGDRYEYEMNVLMQAARRKLPIREIPIDTIYENNNKGSHFHPVRDSVRIYARILKYSLSSLLAFFIDFLLLMLFKHLIDAEALGFGEAFAVTLSAVLARAISSAFNFICNRMLVFRHHGSLGKSLCQYYTLALCVLGAKVVVLNLLDLILPLAFANLITEAVLYLTNYQIQKRLIFASGKRVKKQ